MYFTLNSNCEQFDNSITKVFSYIDAGLMEKNSFNLPSILIEKYSQLCFKIGKFEYSEENYWYIYKLLEKTLNSIECLNIKYEESSGRWICEYGTPPIENQLTLDQYEVYVRKNSLFILYITRWPCFNTNKRKITYETVYLTNILKIPFNTFMKAGVSENMRYNLRSEIRIKAKEMFPLSNIGQTPWSETYSLTQEDHFNLNNIREWSKVELVLRKNSKTNELNIYLNRIGGDQVSAGFIYKTIKESLEGIKKEDLIWCGRSNYLKMIEGCQIENNYETHIIKYLFNEFIVREICLY